MYTNSLNKYDYKPKCISKDRHDIQLAKKVFETFENKNNETNYKLLGKYLKLEIDELEDESNCKQETFHICLENRGNMTEANDLHLEMLYTINIDNIVNDFCFPDSYLGSYYKLVITNDNKLHKKYRSVINYDEFLMLCGFECYEKRNITISSSFFNSLDKETFNKFIKILSGEIVSASMNYGQEETIVNDHESYYGLAGDGVYFEGWNENCNFQYFAPPERYATNKGWDGLFYFEDVKSTNLVQLKSLINMAKLIGYFNTNRTHIVDWKNGYLKYYDNIEKKRLYIKKEHLTIMIANPDAKFKSRTKLDRNHYIEYYILEPIETNNNYMI